LTSGRSTQGHRFESTQPTIQLRHAESYAEQMREEGAVIASFAERRAELVRQFDAAAARQGLTPIADEALLDEVTGLVERPNVLLCRFEQEFLAVPQECLILTMKANQKYFPLLDGDRKLTNQFLIVSNISPADPSRVIEGNERVVRPASGRRQVLLRPGPQEDAGIQGAGAGQGRLPRQAGLAGRARRTGASHLARHRGAAGERRGATCQQADRAALLAKADLLTDMVGEFPELQGVMGGYYARHDGEPEAVAQAIEDHYKPRFAGDSLAREEHGQAGIVVALADKLETLAGLFGIGQLPTGDKDPFALRRHALGIIRMLVERGLPLDLPSLVHTAFATFPPSHGQAQGEVLQFLYERVAGYCVTAGTARKKSTQCSRCGRPGLNFRSGWRRCALLQRWPKLDPWPRRTSASAIS
jgi:glycyl-tRNA synthetase beta chain